MIVSIDLENMRDTKSAKHKNIHPFELGFDLVYSWLLLLQIQILGLAMPPFGLQCYTLSFNWYNLMLENKLPVVAGIKAL